VNARAGTIAVDVVAGCVASAEEAALGDCQRLTFDIRKLDDGCMVDFVVISSVADFPIFQVFYSVASLSRYKIPLVIRFLYSVCWEANSQYRAHFSYNGKNLVP